MFCSDDPTDFVVEYNSVFLSETKKAQVEKIMIHPKFNISTFENDIAILHVKPIDISLNGTKTICLPQNDDDPLENTTMTVTGWGRLNYSYSYEPSQLMAVDVPAISRDYCDKMMKEYQNNTDIPYYYPITKTMICAGYEEGKKDACIVRGFYHFNK